jgi:hypothetical protein
VSGDSTTMNVLRWFFGGQRYRFNLAMMGGLAAGFALEGWETIAIGIGLSLLVLVWFRRRYKRWMAAGGDDNPPRPRRMTEDDI